MRSSKCRLLLSFVQGDQTFSKGVFLQPMNKQSIPEDHWKDDLSVGLIGANFLKDAWGTKQLIE